MKSTNRPPCIVNWKEIEGPDNNHYPGDDEMMDIDASFGRHFGLNKLGIHHQRLLPGRRTSYPHAESSEEEFVYVIEGAPDVWLDGRLHRLQPGDAVGFPAGTGLCHSFLNNTDAEVRLLIVGEHNKLENRVYYPLNPGRKAQIHDWWDDPPKHPLDDHDGLTDKVREWKAKKRTT